MTSLQERLNHLGNNLPILQGIRRGIEKEGLRVDAGTGQLSMKPHPAALGAAVTHSRITTDYSEALLELVTGTHQDVDGLMQELDQIHRFVVHHLDDEIIWNQSMPPRLPAAEDIPVGQYGSSNSGRLRHVYRLGLAERYGKPMQCIAGIHYNFSIPDDIWGVLNGPSDDMQEARSTGYLALIRNFMRECWLLMYLFGASPALHPSFFLKGVTHKLERLNDDTLYLPWATSLRMSDIGYHNKAQSDLQLCYNDLDTFLGRIYTAVTTPWPDYEAIGTHRNGQWIQLNTNILQIENEYYSSIRPKRVTGRGERPATALAKRGVEYVEVRCMDVDPFAPLGISAATCRFLDAFLLYCTVENSPDFPDGGFCTESRDNFSLIVSQGRRPGLTLSRDNQPADMREWALDILERMQPYAQALDAAAGNGGDEHMQALLLQRAKVLDTSLTPSARVLQGLRNGTLSLHDYTLAQSHAHHLALLEPALDAATLRHFEQEAATSIQAQKDLEASDTESFDSYVARFHAALLPAGR